MITMVEDSKASSTGSSSPDLESLIRAMGKRLQSEYIEGAIPFLKTHEPELWAKLEQLDREDSLAALMAYEKLFFEGLRSYLNFLNRKAA